MSKLSERWRATVPGYQAHCMLVDASSGSVFIGDGWGVAYAALRLHRLNLLTGSHLAEVRTRHQAVCALATHEGNLYAAADSRLFELDPVHLAIRRQWERGLVRYTMRLIPDGQLLVAANWLKSSIGVFDPDSGRTRLVRCGRQPLVLKHQGAIKVANGFDGGIAILDTKQGRLLDSTATLPLSAADAGEHIWAVAAGPPTGGQGEPPVWTRLGSETVVRLTGSEWRTRLPGNVAEIYSDDKRAVVWCLLRHPNRQLVAISQHDGKTIHTFLPPEGSEFHHMAPASDVAFAMVAHEKPRGDVVESATSTCLCLQLPQAVS